MRTDLREYNAALATRIAAATSLRATRVGDFDPRMRGYSKPLFVVSDSDVLKEIVPCLAVDEGSLAEEIHLMTPGDVQLNFLQGHEHLVSLVFIHPHLLRWPDVARDARLRDGASLTRWLATRGWTPPP